MNLEKIDPNNDFRIPTPKVVTIAFTDTSLYRITTVKVTYDPGQGAWEEYLDGQNNSKILRNIPVGSDVVIRNIGPEVINVSWGYK